MNPTTLMTKLVLVLTLTSLFYSCKQNEEFYEKNFIETFKDQYDDRVNQDSEILNDDDFKNDPNRQVDHFTQSQQGKMKLDILWVIDNSGSMRPYQLQLGYNFNSFINQFIHSDIDFKMGITTTDTSSVYKAGIAVNGSLTELTSEKLSENQDKFLDNFSQMVDVGRYGSSRERGIMASHLFLENYAETHYREDAYLIIVYVSDEEDQSILGPTDYYNEIIKFKKSSGLVKTYGIVKMSDSQSGGRIDYGYARYKKMSDLSGGYLADINEDFYQTLLEMGEKLVNLSESFPLSKSPKDKTSIQVRVDNQNQIDGWIYDEDSRTVKFLTGYIPTENSEIKISYDI